MENPIKMDDLGAHPYFWKHPYGKLRPKLSDPPVGDFTPFESNYQLVSHKISLKFLQVVVFNHLDVWKKLPSYGTEDPKNKPNESNELDIFAAAHQKTHVFA